MLNHLRQRAGDLLAEVTEANLSTSGPAGLQARVFACEAAGLDLYLLVPGTSDHLFNLETETEAVVSTAAWQIHGSAAAMPLAAAPGGLRLPERPDAAGCVLVAVRPRRMQVYRAEGWGYGETIDIEI